MVRCSSTTTRISSTSQRPPARRTRGSSPVAPFPDGRSQRPVTAGRLPFAVPRRPAARWAARVSEPVLFSEHYYRRVLAEFGYAPFAFRQFDFGVAGMDAKTLNARYLCHHNGDRYLRAARTGASGPPVSACPGFRAGIVRSQEGYLPRWRRCTCLAGTWSRQTSTQPRKTTTTTTPCAGP